MAKLQSNDLTLDIKFNSFKDEWINYDIKFYWKGKIIVNDNILKRTSEFWSRRGYGTFLANDYERDYLIEIIRNAINTNKPECWEPMEPDAKIAIYPGRFFPFLKTPYNLFEEMEEMRREKEAQGKQDDDLFTVIAFIDSYNFKDSNSYSAEGISLHLIVKRQDLENFATDLKMEYDDLMNQANHYINKDQSD